MGITSAGGVSPVGRIPHASDGDRLQVENSTPERWAINIHMPANPSPQLKKGLLEVFANISVESRFPRWLGHGK